MDAKTVSSAVTGFAMAAYGVAAVRRGYRRRRAYWTRRSWASMTIIVVMGFALVGVGLTVSAADKTWIGAPSSNARAAWILVSLGALVGGTFLAAGALAWFADGDATRQFGLLGPGRQERRAASGATPGEQPATSTSHHRQPNEG